MPPNRIVALFAPFVALAAGVTATWLTDHVSGLDVSAGQLEAVFIAAPDRRARAAAQWLHGSQKLARFEAEIERAALDADTRAAELAGEQDPGQRGGRYGDYEDEAARTRRRLRGRPRRARAGPGRSLRCPSTGPPPAPPRPRR